MAASTLNYNDTNARDIAAQQRAQIAQQGQGLTQQEQQEQANNEGAASGTQDYLGGIEGNLAAGNGGYTPQEASQIEFTPQDQQNLVNSAGISAGVANQAAVGGAERAAAAAGGNPAAMATYRARAAQQSAVNSGNAMTQARATGTQLAQQGAEAVGNARLAQQNQGLGYYNSLQQQQNQNAQQDLGLQNQTYGTQTSGTNTASNIGLQASQTPSTFDKVIGGIAGFLEDGSVPTGSEAVIAEDGPEKVVDMGGHDYMADGGLAGAPAEGVPMDDDQSPGAPLPPTPSAPAAGGSAPWWKKLTSNSNSLAVGGGGQPQQKWNPTTTASNLGKIAGAGAKLAGFMEDGGTVQQGKNGVFTKPTRVSLKPNEAVVPLTYRPSAKIRPSMASLPAAKTRQPYGMSA